MPLAIISNSARFNPRFSCVCTLIGTHMDVRYDCLCLCASAWSGEFKLINLLGVLLTHTPIRIYNFYKSDIISINQTCIHACRRWDLTHLTETTMQKAHLTPYQLGVYEILGFVATDDDAFSHRIFACSPRASSHLLHTWSLIYIRVRTCMCGYRQKLVMLHV